MRPVLCADLIEGMEEGASEGEGAEELTVDQVHEQMRKWQKETAEFKSWKACRKMGEEI